ncbi:MAG: SMC-Scp complex subunit ScpB [Nanoarchaeota archaeon]
MDDKNKVEAVLFTVGKFLSIEEIAKLVGIGSVGYVRELLEEIKKEYSNRSSALEIITENGKWKLSIKKDYLYLTEKLLTDSELDKPTQETLAIVAYKNPVLQAEVIKIRGNKAYDHVKTLVEHSFVTSEKAGRTRLLKLTPKFFEYFDVVEDKLNLKDEKDIQH